MKRSLLLLALLASACVKRPLPLTDDVLADGGIKTDLKGTPDFALPPQDLAEGQTTIGIPCTGDASGMLSQGSCPSPDELCVPDAFGFPDGYCVADCSMTDCPTGSTCLDAGGGNQVCFRDCIKDLDCREGYICDPDVSVCIPSDLGQEAEVTPGTRDGGACVTPVVSPMPGHFGANAIVSNPDDFAAEVELAVDPKTKNVVVAWINLGQTDDGIAFVSSQDKGATFSSPVYLPKNDGMTQAPVASDPVVAVDAKGNFYVTWVGYRQTQQNPDPTNMNVFVARSQNGGVSFDDVIRITPTDEWSAGGIDKPWISANPAAADGAIWATWQVTDNDTGGSQIRMARSTDQGATWSTPITVDDGTRGNLYRNLAMVYVDATGKAIVTWTEIANDPLGETANRVFVQRFLADGTKDGMNVRVTHNPDSPTFEDAAVVANGEHVYVSFISGDASGAWDVRVAKSDDGGATFADSVKVNDDESCATHFHQAMDVDEKGRLHVIWYDNRYLVGNVMHAVTTNDAADALVFSPSTFVSDKSFEFSTSRANELWLGDYLGLSADGTDLYAAWTDPRSGQSQIAFAKGTLP